MRQLNDLSHQKFVLGFNPVSDEGPETEAIKDIISISPNIPLGDFQDLAGRLAVAMKGIMDYLGEISGDGINWQGGRPPFANNDWQIDVQQSLGVKTSWVIRTFWNEDPTLLDRLKEDLNAGLSLWMYSIACTNSSLNRLYSFHDELRIDQVSNLPSFRQVTPKERGYFVRIVGSAGSKTDEEIRHWVPFKYCQLVPSYGGKWWNEEMNNIFSGLLGTRDWPVFGLFYSSSFK